MRSVQNDFEAAASAERAPAAAARVPKRGGPAHVLMQAATGVVVLCVLVRLTVADRVPGLAVLYYATPPIVLAAVVAATALAAAIGGRRRTATWRAALALALATWWHGAAHFGRSPIGWGEWLPRAVAADSSTADIAASGRARVAYWNVARGALGWRNVVDALNGFEADLIGLGECRLRDDLQRIELASRLEEREVWYSPADQMMLLSRAAIHHLHGGELGPHGSYHLLRTRLRDQDVFVLLVDLNSDPFCPRGPAIRALGDMVAALGDRPVILMGDFNTPLDSSHWSVLRPRMTHAFESAGNGYAVTWPQPMPVMIIDHVWLAGGLRAAACELPWTLASDHRPVIVDLE